MKNMMLTIDELSDIPIYTQIRNQIVIGISNGSLEPNEKLPTVRALAQEIGINTMTVSKAYQLLKQEGYITSDKRNGARVRKRDDQEVRFTRDSKKELVRIAAEAKLSGISRDEFIDMCVCAYEGKGKGI